MAPRSSKIFSFFFSIAYFTIFIVSSVYSAEISSKIDLDDEQITPPSTLSSSVLKAFVDINQGSEIPGLAHEPSRITSKEPSQEFRQPLMTRPANNHRVKDDGDYISIQDLFKGKRDEIHQNPISGSSFFPGIQGFYGEPEVRPTIINNIHVTINTNDSGPGVNGCKNGLCDVRVTSKPDAEGNVVTNVHLSVVTKLKKNPVQVSDVPVIEGTAGLRRSNFDQLPAFHFFDENVRHGGSLFDNNIPQIPIHRQDVDSWYLHHQSPAIFQRSRPIWHYGRNMDRTFENHRSSHDRESQNEWRDSRNRGIVDDKIEPPLSKTKSSNEED